MCDGDYKSVIWVQSVCVVGFALYLMMALRKIDEQESHFVAPNTNGRIFERARNSMAKSMNQRVSQLFHVSFFYQLAEIINATDTQDEKSLWVGLYKDISFLKSNLYTDN